MRAHDAEIPELLKTLGEIRDEIVAAADARADIVLGVHERHRLSAENLLHYLALRRRDLRALQLRLAALGLSSLGRAESHVLATVESVLAVLHRLAGARRSPAEQRLDFTMGERLLTERTTALLGPAAPGRDVRIMVTMPSEAAHDYLLIHDLLHQGMDAMRINCAHDDAETWGRMIENLRRAEQALGRRCRIVMDLAGPKLRTGPMEAGPAVLHLRPRRDAYGHVIAASRIWFTDVDDAVPAPSPADAELRVPRAWLSKLNPGDSIRFVDARGARRRLEVMDATGSGAWAEARESSYLIPETRLKHRPGDPAADKRRRDPGVNVLGIPAGAVSLTLHAVDHLVITRDLEAGKRATHDSAGAVLTPATIGCTIPEVFDDVRAGESIWFDDGKVGAVVESVERSRVLVRITHTRAAGGRLRADQGINLPESALRLGALTADDLRDLEFAARHADVIELSFANDATDVEALQGHLARLVPEPPGIVLKIETRRGFEHLPEMLLVAMRSPAVGVMIARGDLAVECGFERLAEVQEEILWICEAAHVPVIWATQVLETLAKEGMPSRAEITDAAMGHRAECVMLNKGPHVRAAVRVLDDILRRMRTHQAKKRSMLRELRLAHAFQDDAPAEPLAPTPQGTR